jgi:hypothetical protein
MQTPTGCLPSSGSGGHQRITLGCGRVGLPAGWNHIHRGRVESGKNRVFSEDVAGHCMGGQDGVCSKGQPKLQHLQDQHGDTTAGRVGRFCVPYELKGNPVGIVRFMITLT